MKSSRGATHEIGMYKNKNKYYCKWFLLHFLITHTSYGDHCWGTWSDLETDSWLQQ